MFVSRSLFSLVCLWSWSKIQNPYPKSESKSKSKSAFQTFTMVHQTKPNQITCTHFILYTETFGSAIESRTQNEPSSSVLRFFGSSVLPLLALFLFSSSILVARWDKVDWVSTSRHTAHKSSIQIFNIQYSVCRNTIMHSRFLFHLHLVNE